MEPEPRFRFKLGRDVLESAPRRHRRSPLEKAGLVRTPLRHRLLPGCDPQRKSSWQNNKPSPPGTPIPLRRRGGLPEAHAKVGFWTLLLGSIGVVYGDIGTSPLYAFKESVAAAAGGRPASTPRHRPRRPVADPVVAGPRRHAQIRPRSCCAPTTTARAARSTLVALAQRALGRRTRHRAPARHRRRRAVLRRRGHHAGDLGALGRRGPEARRRRPRQLRRADHPRHPGRRSSRCRAAAPGRVAAFFGPIMLVWFATLALTGLLHIADDPAVLTAINPLYARAVLRQPSGRRRSPCSARSASPSPAPRRSMPISAISAAGRSAPPGSASCSRRSSSTISARARSSCPIPAAAEHPLYRLVPGMGAPADDRARDAGDDHREPGGDHRRLLADAAGRSSSASCRGSRSASPRSRTRARSTCRA